MTSDFGKLYKRSTAPTMSATDRKKTHVLLVESDAQIRQTMRQSLHGLAYENISEAADHAAAIQKFEERHVTHVIFEAKQTKIPAKEFLRRAFEMDPKLIAIPTSYEPTIDDVFDLLIMGAKGYVVKPFTAESLDDAIIMATKGEPISDSILNAKNRNEALSALVLSAVDKLATILRQAKKFDTAKHEVPAKVMTLKRSVDIARTFAKGGPVVLRDTLVDMLIDRSEGPATRLGRYRQRLEKRKARKEEEAQLSGETEIIEHDELEDQKEEQSKNETSEALKSTETVAT